jgi:hypothetical protein
MEKINKMIIVWPSICSFCLSRRYLVAIALSDLRFLASVYLVGRRDKQKLQIEGQTIQWPQYTDDINSSYKSKVRKYNGHLISSVSCGHCIVWLSICSFCLSRRYLGTIVLSDLRFDNIMAIRYRRDQQKLQIEGQTIQWPQDTDEINRSYCLCFSRLYLVAIVLSDLRFVASVYLVCLLWPLYCLTFDKTIQWPQDTDEINRGYKSKVRQYNGHKIPTR